MSGRRWSNRSRKPLGIEHIDMPATPSRVWAAINAAGGMRAAAE
jgi:hypothetical protein